MEAGDPTDTEMLRKKLHYSLEDYRLWMLQVCGPLDVWWETGSIYQITYCSIYDTAGW